MAATTCENWPAGFFAVPLNIRCSRKCASPDLPGVSSAAPTLYQIMWVTTGARWSGMTTSSNPLPNMKSEICGPLGADCAPLAIASNAAMAAAVSIDTARIGLFALCWRWSYALAAQDVDQIADLATHAIFSEF